MTKIIYIFMIISLLISCSNTPDYELDKKEIITLLTKNAKCYKTKNLDCMMDTYLKDSTTITFGTNRESTGRGWDSVRVLYEKDFSPNWEMISYEYENPIINVHDDIAWISADIKSEIKLEIQSTGFNLKLDSRLTAVCKKIDGKWKFVMTNFQHFIDPDQALSSQINKLMSEE